MAQVAKYRGYTIIHDEHGAGIYCLTDSDVVDTASTVEEAEKIIDQWQDAK